MKNRLKSHNFINLAGIFCRDKLVERMLREGIGQCLFWMTIDNEDYLR